MVQAESMSKIAQEQATRARRIAKEFDVKNTIQVFWEKQQGPKITSGGQETSGSRKEFDVLNFCLDEKGQYPILSYRLDDFVDLSREEVITDLQDALRNLNQSVIRL